MEKRNLNFLWQYYAKFEDNLIKNECENTNFELVNIPHTNKMVQLNYFDESESAFVSCYRKSIVVEQCDADKIFVLEFMAVGSYAKVYVNGKFAGEHKGGYTSFKINITNLVVVGSNIIVVVCDSTERGDIPPFGNVVDYLCYGGIYREVYLCVYESSQIDKVFISSSDPMAKNKPYNASIVLERVDKSMLTVLCEVYYKGELVSKISNTTSTSNISLAGIIENAVLWDTVNPALYVFNIYLMNGKSILDSYSCEFGFRLTEFLPSGFYLNKQHLKLRGLNRHQSYPYVGYAMPKSMQEEDAKFLKNTLKVNCVRTSHYPQSHHFVSECDRLGLLVITEAPGWQHIGGDDFKAVFKNSVREMVEQYYNHTSIIMWGVRVNESADCDELYIETNKIARSIDSTRHTGGVRNFGGSKLYEDVYTYNDFLHTGNNDGLSTRKEIAKANVPYLITENNGHVFPTKRFDGEMRRTSHAIRHATVMNSAYSSNEYCGEIGWCMSDYNTHNDFGSGDRICYHGVTDMFRIPKLAGQFYASQGATEPFLEISSELSPGDNDNSAQYGFYAFTNCELVKVYNGDTFVGDFKRTDSTFKHLPNPPIYIPDLIGSLILRNENFSKSDAKTIKKLILRVAKVGLAGISLLEKMQFGLIMVKYKMKMDDAFELFGKYAGSWGGKKTAYRFEGYLNGEKIVTKYKGYMSHKQLEYEVSATTLFHGDERIAKNVENPKKDILQEEISSGKVASTINNGEGSENKINTRQKGVNYKEKIECDTYDVASVKITCVSEYGNLLPYAFDGVTLEASGGIELIGENSQNLIGGALGVYVKTTKKGKGALKIKFTNACNEAKIIEFIVE